MTMLDKLQPHDIDGKSPTAEPVKTAPKSWVLAAAALGSSIVFVDGSVVNIALPRIQIELGATGADMQWVVESYTLMLASLILVGGSLGDRLGRKRIFAVGVVIFTLASLGCGFASSVDILILARAVQGLGGALLTPGSLALISANFSEQERGRAFGKWSGWTTIATAIGPVLGGWIVQAASWRWVFFINLPLAVAVLAILFAKVPESKDEAAEKNPLDWAGGAFATLGLGGMTYGLIRLGIVGVSHTIAWATFGAGAVLITCFFLTESKVKSPMMPLKLFDSRTFSGANALTLLLYAALGGALYFLPFNLIQVHHYQATAAGASLLPFVLVMFLTSTWAGGLVDRFGPRKPLIIGPLIAAGGFALLAIPGVSGPYWTTFFPGIIVLGFGMAITVVPLTTVVMSSAPSDEVGVASGINNAVSRIASLIAIAFFGVILASVFSSNLSDEMSRRGAPASVVNYVNNRKDELAAIVVPTNIDGHNGLQAEISGAYVDGFRDVMFTASFLAMLSAAASAMLIKERQGAEKR